MSIAVEHIDNWDNKPVKHKKNKYPTPLDLNSPRMYFVCLAIGSRGSGKTFSIVKLIKQYEKFGIMNQVTHEKTAQRVILFSPTVDANPIFNSLKNLNESDIMTNYSDDKLVEVIEDIKRENDETKEYQKSLELYHKFVKHSKKTPEQLSKIFTPEELAELDTMNYEEPMKPAYPNGCVNFLIFDDLIGSSAFKSVGRSALTNLVLKNRHLGCNILIATQSLKSIPKSIRNNTSLFILYRFANKKIVLDDLYEEVSGKLKPKEFEEIYDFATEGDHDALVMDFTGSSKELTFRKNFDTSIKIS
jgi:hypothetical protein